MIGSESSIIQNNDIIIIIIILKKNNTDCITLASIIYYLKMIFIFHIMYDTTKRVYSIKQTKNLLLKYVFPHQLFAECEARGLTLSTL